MRSNPPLYWLPADADWKRKFRQLAENGSWDEAVGLANTRLDFIRTNALDDAVRRRFGNDPPPEAAGKPVRLAVLGSSTLSHLLPGIRVGGLRRGLWIAVYENAYGQYLQELFDPGSPLHRFQPNAVLFAFDRFHLAAGLSAAMDRQAVGAARTEVLERIRNCWSRARAAFKCQILQQTVLPDDVDLLGNNEHRLPGSRGSFIRRLNDALRDMADTAGVDLVAVDRWAERDGLAAWHDVALWHRSKQDVLPSMAPTYGDLVARLLAAAQGRSRKCLVLDLDNTIWGGVIGDDGLHGIVLGQGSGLGEAFAALQHYARELSRRGVILAVCSKNDAANVIEAFDRHPEMVLRRGDIASLAANWQDKPANLRAVAEQLNIGLDTLVLVDDNPFERDLVRHELPMVAVPEVPDDPGYIPRCLSDAGYFESVAITEEDRERTRLYQGNTARERLRTSATDLSSYLRGLEMQLLWRRFDEAGLPRIVQLINKTNQFNLTTRRYNDDDIRAVIADERAFGLQLRLFDRFGDNGIIGIVTAKMADNEDLVLDTWLMSCRVLGRQVERATLTVVAQQAQRLGARRLIGEYVPSRKNAIVADHYERLGFTLLERRPDGGSRGALDLHRFSGQPTFIEIKQA